MYISNQQSLILWPMIIIVPFIEHVSLRIPATDEEMAMQLVIDGVRFILWCICL